MRRNNKSCLTLRRNFTFLSISCAHSIHKKGNKGTISCLANDRTALHGSSMRSQTVSSVCMHDCLCVSKTRGVYAGSKGVSPATLQFVLYCRDWRPRAEDPFKGGHYLNAAFAISLFGIGRDKEKRLENIVSRYANSILSLSLSPCPSLLCNDRNYIDANSELSSPQAVQSPFCLSVTADRWLIIIKYFSLEWN